MVKPLATKLAKFKYSIGDLFDKADKNRNFYISAEELAEAIRVSTNEKLDLEEVQMISEYF